MTPSSPPSYEFLDTHPSLLLSFLASNTPNSNTTHQPAANSSPHSTPTLNSNQAQSTSIHTSTTSHPLGPLPDIHITPPQPSPAQPNPPTQPPQDPIELTKWSHGRNLVFLSQKKYACEPLERANMVNCNPSRGLQYLTFTRPDLSYAVQHICLYMHDPRERHFAALKRILWYVRGTVDFGLQLYASATTSLVGYTDADWAGCPSTRHSTSGYCVFLGDNLLSWSSKRQHTISRSSAEAEYRGVGLVYCDNVSAVYLSANPVQHQRTKHIEIDIHFIRDMVQTGHIRVLHVPSRYQYADIFTKGLLTALFENFRSSLSVRLPPAQTARAY
nr:ribonuclease H-like domain-containing protein [Tanacetum cinerariifolium]